MNYNTKFTAIAMALLIVSIALPSIASAQVSSITFSRPLTMDTSLSSIEFGFGILDDVDVQIDQLGACLLYTSPSPRDRQKSRMPSSA